MFTIAATQFSLPDLKLQESAIRAEWNKKPLPPELEREFKQFHTWFRKDAGAKKQWQFPEGWALEKCALFKFVYMVRLWDQVHKSSQKQLLEEADQSNPKTFTALFNKEKSDAREHERGVKRNEEEQRLKKENPEKFEVEVRSRKRKSEQAREERCRSELHSYIDRRYNSYKKDHQEEIWELTKEEFDAAATQPCAECGAYNDVSGNCVIRHNRKLPWSHDNVETICQDCSFIRRYTIDAPEEAAALVAVHLGNYSATRVLDSNCISFSTHFPNMYKVYEGRARANEIPFELSRELFEELIHSPCYYCNLRPDAPGAVCGIDRKDSSRGYELDNVVPCCKTHNYMKVTLSVEKFIKLCVCTAKRAGLVVD